MPVLCQEGFKRRQLLETYPDLSPTSRVRPGTSDYIFDCPRAFFVGSLELTSYHAAKSPLGAFLFVTRNGT